MALERRTSNGAGLPAGGLTRAQTAIAACAEAVLGGRSLDRAEARELIEAGAQAPYELFRWAWRIRTRHFGRAVQLCSIVSGKLGGCSEDCAWCAQSAVSTPSITAPQRSTDEQIRRAAREARSVGSAHIGLVNSGLGPGERDLAQAVSAIEEIRRREPDITPCASLGVLTPETARRLAEAGLKRYHHNLETSARLFAELVSTHSYDDRLQTLRNARDAGMAVCCGGIFGLGETWDDRLDLAFLLRREVRPVSVPLNFLQAIPGTPLADRPALPALEALQIIAVYRFLLPTTDLRIAGGREHVLGDLQSWIFYAGATGCMVGHYLTTTGRNTETDLAMIRQLDLEVVAELPRIE